MNVNVDRLGILGALTGVFLVLVALGTAAGTPWTHSGGTIVMILQILGIVATAAIGIALVWLTQLED